MWTTVYNDLDVVNPSAYHDILGQDCREVLMGYNQLCSSCHSISLKCYLLLRFRDLEDKLYAGDLTGLLNIDLVGRALEQAYGKILRLLHHVVALKGVHNSYLPVSRLPAELLLRIFRSCTSQNGIRDRNWLAFSQVCTHWRRLALADPSLWNTIDLEHHDLAKLLVTRSQSMPVFVAGSSEDLSLSFIPSRDRIHSLTLTHSANSDAAEADVTNYLSGQFPLLHALIFIGVDDNAFTCDLSIIDAPRLQDLFLYNWTLHHWNTSAMSNLASLTLVYDPSGPQGLVNGQYETIFTLPAILDTIRACPRLLSLRLEGLVNTWRIHDLPDDATNLAEVELSYLKELYLVEDVIMIAGLLQYLRLPASEDITIHCRTLTEVAKERLSGLAELLSHFLHTARWKVPDAARLTCDSDLQLEILARKHASQSTVDRCRLRVMLLDRAQYDETETFLRRFALNLLPDIVALTVDGNDGMQRYLSDTVFYQFWTVVSTLPALQAVTLDGGMRFSFVPILVALVPGLAVGELEDGITRSENPFPALRSLVIRNVHMSRVIHGQSVFGHLKAFVNHRVQENRAITVVLENCPLLKLDAELLEPRDDIQIVNTQTRSAAGCSSHVVNSIGPYTN